MSCPIDRSALSASLDGRLRESERRELSTHLKRCRECSTELAELAAVRGRLRGLPSRTTPPLLVVSLRILASRERIRNLRRASVSSLLRAWATDLRLVLDNLMRPIAIPAAGGLLSALMIFTMVLTMPGFATPGRDVIPTSLYTQAILETMAPFGLDDSDLVVDVLIDENGRLIDYSLPQSPGLMKNAAMRQSIENSLLFARYTPATAFGQPTAGRIRVTRVHVRG